MNLQKIDNVLQFSDYKSFFKFINNWDGDLVVRKFEVYSNDELIAVFNHKSK